MYNLFLETRAAAQVREWCRLQNPGDELEAIRADHEEELLQAAYKNACNCEMWDDNQGGYSGYLVARALEDRHRGVDIDTSFMWAATPEGKEFWARINRMIVPIPKKLI